MTPMPDGYIATISATRLGVDADTKAQVLCTTDKAFGASDTAHVVYGEDPNDLNQSTDPVSLPTARRVDFGFTLTGLTVTNRCYYQIVIQEDGVDDFITERCQISNIPDSVEEHPVTVISIGDEHAVRHLYEEATPNFPTQPNRVKAPGDATIQMRDMAYEALAAEIAGDGGPPHMIWEGGDWTQSHLTSGHWFPNTIEGIPSPSADSASLKSQQDADYMVAAVCAKNRTLRNQQRVVKPSNHGGNQSWCHGSSWDGTNGKMLVAGRNTISPQRDVAGWHIDALRRIVGISTGEGIVGSGDPHGRWGYIDMGGVVRYIWIDPYVHSKLFTTDPNTLPNSVDDVTHWTIGAIADWLFNASTGVYSTCTLPNIRLKTHQFTSADSLWGPGNYGWVGSRKASIKGGEPSGEWPGAADFKTADPYEYNGSGTTWKQELYDYGVEGLLVMRRPATAITVVVETNHAHFPLVEKPFNGIFHIQHGRIVAGQDSIKPGPMSVGHYNINEGLPRGWDAEDALYRSNNATFTREDVYARRSVYSIKKLYMDFDGQKQRDGVTDVNPADVAPGGTLNPGPNAVDRSIAIGYRLELSHPDHPLESFYDSFGEDCKVEDSTTMEDAGGEQLPLSLIEPNRRISSNLGAHYKHFSSDAATPKTYLAVRASIMDGSTVLSTRRPFAADADMVTQSMRRRIRPTNRRLTVMVRQQDVTVPVVIRLGGGDVNIPVFFGGEWTPNGYGLFLAGDGTGNLSLAIDDGKSLEVLATTEGAVISDAWASIQTTVANGRVQVKAGSTVVIDYTLAPEHWEWFSSPENSSWIGLTSGCDNKEGLGGVTEFRGLDVRPASLSRSSRSRGRHRSRATA